MKDNDNIRVLIYPVGKVATLVVIGTDCTGRCKSNYHTIKTTTSPHKLGTRYDTQ